MDETAEVPCDPEAVCFVQQQGVAARRGPITGAKLPLLLIAERPVTCLGDLQHFDFKRLPPFANHALSGLGGESDAHQLCQLVGREAVHAHDSFGATFRAATDEQRKRAALIGLWVARRSEARHLQPILTQRLRLGENY